MGWKMNKHELIEGFGFFLEIICFIMTGFFIWISLIATVMFFICGLALALFVGKKIKENAMKEEEDLFCRCKNTESTVEGRCKKCGKVFTTQVHSLR